MGNLARAIKAGNKLTADAGAGGGWNVRRRDDSRSAWAAAFHRAEEDNAKPMQRDGMGRSVGRSLASPNANSFTQLLKALRSDAPGGWTDDRYEQTLRHFVGITYVAIHRLSQQMSRAEFQVFREDPHHPDGRVPVTREDHDGWALVQLLKKPNRQDSFGKVMYRILQQKMLTGSGLVWMVPNKLGRPYELYSIPTAIAIPQAATNPLYPNGYYRVQPLYPYGPFSTWPSPSTSVGAAIPGEWMLKFQYPHPLLRYEGYSPQTALRLHIDSIDMIDKVRFNMTRRGIAPNAVLNPTDVEGGGSEELQDADLDRIKAMFEEDHVGPENMGKLLVAYAGWKLERWGELPKDMAFESGWDQLSSFILGGGFGITKPAAGMVDESSYGGLFATMKQLHLTTLEPETEDVGSILTRQLAPFFGDDLIVDVRLPRIDDHEIKFTMIDKAIQGKCITKNELRKELNFPLTREDWGKDFAGTEPQQEQPGMPGAEQPTEGAQNANDPMAALAAMAGGEEGAEPAEAKSPDTGTLGANSKGPRPGSTVGQVKRFGRLLTHGKGLGKLARERPAPKPQRSLYDLALEALPNGYH